MNPMDLRLQALRLAVDTKNPNTVVKAREFLSFLREDEAPVKAEQRSIERGKQQREAK
jgi:hypothetical protein